MRVSPVGFAYDSLAEVLLRAKWTAEVTHDHPEAIQGAPGDGRGRLPRPHDRRQGADPRLRRAQVQLQARPDDRRDPPRVRFQRLLPGDGAAGDPRFLESTDYEGAVRLAVSLGGDADTLACIAGGIAQAYYGGVPADIRDRAVQELDEPLRAILDEFEARFLLG